jgi:hypothetical protein
MDMYYCGVVESNLLLQFPYSAQPILCTPQGQFWRRVEYRVSGGTLVGVRAIGEPRPLAHHSFTLGDYVLSEPKRFYARSRLIVLPGHKVVSPNRIGNLLFELMVSSRKVSVRDLPRYLRNSLTVSFNYLQR